MTRKRVEACEEGKRRKEKSMDTSCSIGEVSLSSAQVRTGVQICEAPLAKSYAFSLRRWFDRARYTVKTIASSRKRILDERLNVPGRKSLVEYT